MRTGSKNGGGGVGNGAGSRGAVAGGTATRGSGQLAVKRMRRSQPRLLFLDLGHCWRGDECRFSHDVQRIGGGENSSTVNGDRGSGAGLSSGNCAPDAGVPAPGNNGGSRFPCSLADFNAARAVCGSGWWKRGRWYGGARRKAGLRGRASPHGGANPG